MVFEIQQTDVFETWITDRMRRGNFGDHEAVGGGVWEMRITEGPGYRVYYVERGNVHVVLLCGGDKGSQNRDIERAKAMAGGIK